MDVCGQFQSCTSAQTNLTPALALTPTLTLTLLPSFRGLEARPTAGMHAGAVARLLSVFLWRSSKTLRVAERPASTDQTDISHEIRCLPVLQLGRVPRLRVSVKDAEVSTCLNKAVAVSLRGHPSIRGSHHLTALLRVPVACQEV